jgi:hypothetical protein
MTSWKTTVTDLTLNVKRVGTSHSVDLLPILQIKSLIMRKKNRYTPFLTCQSTKHLVRSSTAATHNDYLEKVGSRTVKVMSDSYVARKEASSIPFISINNAMRGSKTW